MDNVCHTLVGAALGEAGLKRPTRFGNPALMIAANLPDLDVLSFLGDTPQVAIRRGWTHGVLAQALLPLALTAAVLAVDRLRPARNGGRARALPLLLLGYAGVLSHVGLDWLNNYGVRLLMPFSDRWFYGDSVFIVDPLLWVVLAAGTIYARRRVRTSPARLALIASAIYIAAMVTSAMLARRIVIEQWTRAHGVAPASLMVGPVPIDPLHKAVIIDAGDRYETGRFSWASRRLEIDAIWPRRDNDPAVLRAQGHTDIRAILRWSRFPYYEVTPAAGGTRVALIDLRFGSRVGSASVIVDGRTEVRPYD
jgi:inner membrane protein